MTSEYDDLRAQLLGLNPEHAENLASFMDDCAAIGDVASLHHAVRALRWRADAIAARLEGNIPRAQRCEQWSNDCLAKI